MHQDDMTGEVTGSIEELAVYNMFLSVEAGGWEQCLTNRLRGKKQGSSGGQERAFGTPADFAGTCSCGKFIESGIGEAYDAQVRGPNREFQFNQLGGLYVVTDNLS